MRSFHRLSCSYDKLPTEPIRLSVLKLDGSSFDVYVMSSATIADLKLAIETAFSHVPRKGPSKISWSHVWGHFCLCFGDQKLVTDTDSIGSYGLKESDEVRFKNHVSGKVLSKRYSRKPKQNNSEMVMPKDEDEEMKQMEEIDHDSWDDLEKGSFVMYKDDDDDMEASPGESRSCLSTVRCCCFALGLKEFFGFGNDSRSYFSLRDTWRDD